MRKKIKQYCINNLDCYYVTNFGINYYPALLKNIDLVIGNSSSGIIEAHSVKTYSLNIGDRQKGRIISRNILNCKNDSYEITNNLNKIINNYKKYNVKTKIKVASFNKFQKYLDKIITYEK